MLLLLAGLAATVQAAELSLGLGADLVVDPAGQVEPLSDSRAGFGGALRAPLRIELGQEAALRVALASSLSRGHDRVEWQQYEGAVTFYSDDHWTLVNNTSLTVGPTVDIGRWEGPKPYVGAGVGAALVTHHHSFSGDAAVLLDPEQGDLSRGTHIDPYTRQVAPLAELLAGVRIPTSGAFAIEVEAGYTVSFLAEAALKKARPELDATRVAHGLDAMRIGLAAAFPL